MAVFVRRKGALPALGLDRHTEILRGDKKRALHVARVDPHRVSDPLWRNRFARSAIPTFICAEPSRAPPCAGAKRHNRGAIFRAGQAQRSVKAASLPDWTGAGMLLSPAQGRIVAITWSDGPLQRSAPRLSLPALSARLDDS